MQHQIEDELLSHEERITLSRLLSVQAARLADREEEAIQAQRLREINSQRRPDDSAVTARALAESQQSYVPAHRKGRRTVALGAEQAAPSRTVTPQERSTQTGKPTGENILARIKIWIKAALHW